MYGNYNTGRPGGSGYGSSNGSYRGKRRNMKRIRNRAIIIASGVVALVLVILIISSCFSCVCSGCSNSAGNGNVLNTETVSKKKSKKKKPVVKSDTDPTVFNTPEIKDDDDSAGTRMSNLYIWNEAAFEPFFGTEEPAKKFASTMNSMKKKLGSDVNVYTMVIPNHTEFGLTPRLKNTEDGVNTTSQADYIKTVYSHLNKNVIPVNCYNKLSQHCNEYIYFNTDHHWTGLGAYYAYTAFTDVTKQKAISLKDCEKHTIPEFTGSFNTMLGSSAGLKTDSVDFWTFPYEVPTVITNANGNTDNFSSCYYLAEGSGSNAYGVFLWGDQPLEVISSQSKDAKKDSILIVHESYGNALVPYFTYNYKTVYSIDFRSWKGDLYRYCKDKGIKDVLFANGVMSSATAFQLASIEGLAP